MKSSPAGRGGGQSQAKEAGHSYLESMDLASTGQCLRGCWKPWEGQDLGVCCFSHESFVLIFVPSPTRPDPQLTPHLGLWAEPPYLCPSPESSVSRALVATQGRCCFCTGCHKAMMVQNGTCYLMVGQGQADGHFTCSSSFLENLKFFKAQN